MGWGVINDKVELARTFDATSHVGKPSMWCDVAIDTEWLLKRDDGKGQLPQGFQ